MKLVAIWYRHCVDVASVEDAAAKWCAFRDQSGQGVSAIGNGVRVVDAVTAAVVAEISYNGRIWPKEQPVQTQDDASHVEYNPDGSALAFVGPDAVALYAAAALASAMRLYAKTGIKANRAYTPTAMLKRAGFICGKTYKRTQMLQAAEDVTKWVQTMKAALPAVQRSEP